MLIIYNSEIFLDSQHICQTLAI